MSLIDYRQGQQLARQVLAEKISFHAVIQCAMRIADTDNLERLQSAFPHVWNDLQLRYNAPGGQLPDD
ncbi:MAG: hypothetical protein M0R06_00370 [Sphaerochaeta sp.]|jgi:hypothetical protein|nr:hypothetical protein [Sphaerochaeta sp.]